MLQKCCPRRQRFFDPFCCAERTRSHRHCLTASRTRADSAASRKLDRWHGGVSESGPGHPILFEGRPTMRKVTLLLAVLALGGIARTSRAQTATGQITGTVTDTTGAVVPGVTVTVSGDLTGLKRE